MKKFFILSFIVATFSVAGHSQKFNYDVNGDGHVTSVDVSAIYNYIMGIAEFEEHEYVDLGLPSGTMWATMNIGATAPEEYGDYFAWGETSPKSVYDEYNYKWCSGEWDQLTKYCNDAVYGYNGFVDNKIELDPMDDAATVNWGPKWCMPSHVQAQELIDNCTIVWTTMNGVKGSLFTSNINGASLFLPAGGTCMISHAWIGEQGCYWLRTQDVIEGPTNAFVLFTSWYEAEPAVVDAADCARWDGHSVRAVRVP